MWSYLGYIVLPTAMTMITGSAAFSFLWIFIIHNFIARPAFGGWGLVPDFDGDVYYPLIGVLFTVITYLFRWTYNLRSPLSLNWLSRVSDMQLKYVTIRFIKVMFVFVAKVAALLCFELIPLNLWFGGLLTVILLAVANWFPFFLMFRPFYDIDPNKASIGKWFIHDTIFENRNRNAKTKPGEYSQYSRNNYPLMIAIILSAADFIYGIPFWVISEGPYWNIFYLSLILFGFGGLIAIVRLIVMLAEPPKLS